MRTRGCRAWIVEAPVRRLALQAGLARIGRIDHIYVAPPIDDEHKVQTMIVARWNRLVELQLTELRCPREA
jgi:hypothetical protein